MIHQFRVIEFIRFKIIRDITWSGVVRPGQANKSDSPPRSARQAEPD